MRNTSTPLRTPSRLFGMQERADHLDFDVRRDGARNVLAKPHRHEYFQIQVGIEGGHQQLIGSALRPFGTGYLSFVLPYRLHVVHHPPGARWAIVNFDQRFLWPELDQDPAALDTSAAERQPTLAPFLFQEQLDFHFEPSQFERVLGWLDQLLVLNRERGFGSQAAIRGVLLQWLGWVCDQHRDALQPLVARSGALPIPHDALQRALRCVRERALEGVTLQDAARAAVLSPSHLAHLLKKQTGRTFTELVTERRLEHARELLLTSGQRIATVARTCGFDDESYFARRFRRATGLSPRAFRAAARPGPDAPSSD